jgi:hypothetical protein
MQGNVTTLTKPDYNWRSMSFTLTTSLPRNQAFPVFQYEVFSLCDGRLGGFVLPAGNTRFVRSKQAFCVSSRKHAIYYSREFDHEFDHFGLPFKFLPLYLFTSLRLYVFTSLCRKYGYNPYV